LTVENCRRPGPPPLYPAHIYMECPGIESGLP